jgi:hypothetical protein
MQVLIQDAQGRVVFDGSSKLVKLIGSTVIGGAGTPQSGTLVSPWFLQGRPFYMVMRQQGAAGLSGTDAEVAIVGDTLTWRFPTTTAESWQRPTTTILYGIY